MMTKEARNKGRINKKDKGTIKENSRPVNMSVE